MKTLKLNKSQAEALVKCLKNRIELYDIWIGNMKNSIRNQSNSNLAFKPSDKYEQGAIEDIKRYIVVREELNSIVNQL